MGLAGAAAGANESLQEILARAFAERRAQEQIALRQQAQEQSASEARQRLDLQQRNFDADEAYRKGLVERQGRLDDRQATMDRQAENQRGVQRMMGEFITQRGATPLDAGARNQLMGMAIGEGVDLPKAITDDPTAANTEWDRRRAAEQKDALARIGAQSAATQANAAARNSNAPNPEEAASVTRTALGLVDRLEKHKGIGAATGAYELRGFTQDAVDFNAIRDQLVAALALPNLGALKGPMSDKDILFVKQLATRLSNNRLSEAETRTALAEAKTFLESKMGPTSILPPAVDLVWDPVTKTLRPVNADR